MSKSFASSSFGFKNDLSEEFSSKLSLSNRENHIRTINIYPNREELFAIKKPKIQSNIINGPYNSVDHYLNTQFRLLREDFIAPLRKDFQQYCNGSERKLKSIIFHQNIKLSLKNDENKEYVFDIILSKNVDENRFKYGSLLIFTRDVFRTIFCGTVSNSDTISHSSSYGKKFQIIVTFKDAQISKSVLHSSRFLMVEVSPFFLPYYHVLKVLQTINEDTMPLRDYIVYTKFKKEFPLYMGRCFHVNYKNCLLRDDGWLITNFLNLNTSQKKALKAAITEEFVLIQGPPGTGKTYLGIEIAKFLLNNKHLWYENTPMLVVCATNHALDQFLENLSKITKNIIRYGTRSKNIKITPFTVEAKRSRGTSLLTLLQSQWVVGMTTTSAARLNSTILKDLRCPIVIVEEAAEVLEAHIVASLTKHCEHLILMGDHKQLKPKTNDRTTEVKHKLGISLFERMLINNMECHTLNVQHRMRPEIADLLTPTIYKILFNAQSVEKFEPIKGLNVNLYFLHHTKPEGNAGISSKKNEHEAKFLLGLTVYLLQNNYQSEDICILSPYSGQVEIIQKEKKNFPTANQVRISTIDGFQGEEAKIILLSLVRSGSNIGFLATENRICVALSRAREGLYIMGNMDVLVAQSKIWEQINKKLRARQAIGTELYLKCQIHSTITKVSEFDDFQLVNNGGCHECQAHSTITKMSEFYDFQLVNNGRRHERQTHSTIAEVSKFYDFQLVNNGSCRQTYTEYTPYSYRSNEYRPILDTPKKAWCSII